MARTENPKTALAERLSAVRKKLGYERRADFANNIGLATDTLGTYERGDREPGPMLLAEYKRRFAVNLNWLIAGDGEMFSGGEFSMYGKDGKELPYKLRHMISDPEPDAIDLKFYDARAFSETGAHNSPQAQSSISFKRRFLIDLGQSPTVVRW